MASQKTCTTEVFQKVLEEFENNQLIPKHERNEKNIKPVLKKAVEMDALLTSEITPMIDNQNMETAEETISAIIGPERANLIKKSNAMETYTMKVVDKPNGQVAVQISRNGSEFRPEIMLSTINDIEISIWLQWASVVIDVLFLLLACIGIKVSVSKDEMKILVAELELRVQEPAFLKIRSEFLDAWKKAEGSLWEKAKAIGNFLKDGFLNGIYWEIFILIYKPIFGKMSTTETITAILLCVVMIVLMIFITEGLTASIARILLALYSAFSSNFAQKIANLDIFYAKKQGMI